MENVYLLSFDYPASPALTMNNTPRFIEEQKQQHYGWGIAWYPDSDLSNILIKDNAPSQAQVLNKIIDNWHQFNSTLFLYYLYRGEKRYTQQSIQPYSMPYAKRHWVWALAGKIERNLADKLPIKAKSLFEPVTSELSEYTFHWLIQCIHDQNAKSLSDLFWPGLYQNMRTINQYSQASIFFTDGQNVVIYQDKEQYLPLYYQRFTPPHTEHVITSDDLEIRISHVHDVHRTFIVVTTEPDPNYDWHQFQAGQMLVLRQGALIWDSTKDPTVIKLNKQIQSKKSPAQLKLKKDKPFQAKQATQPRNKLILRDPLGRDQKAILNVMHETIYRYEEPVSYSKHYFRLHPVDDRYQSELEYELLISTNGESETFTDVFDNRVTYFVIEEPYTELIVRMNAKVSILEMPIKAYSTMRSRYVIPLVWMPWQRQMMSPYLLPPELPESQLTALTEYAMTFVERNDYDVINLLDDMNQTIYNDFNYVQGATSLATTPFEVMAERKGVCQDFANLFICLARLLSIPARYRSGYVYAGISEENKIQSEASHAWVEVYLPWLGWRGYDPTNGCIVKTEHIRVACGRNFYDATPTSGTIYAGGGKNGIKEHLHVDVKVTVAD